MLLTPPPNTPYLIPADANTPRRWKHRLSVRTVATGRQ
jgi:hypothetical protein